VQTIRQSIKLAAMSDIELVISNSKKLESFLEKHLKATGRGLHEKVGSVERQLPDTLVRRLRYIATIRNKIVHDESYDRIDDRKGFIEACTIANKELRKLAGVKQSGNTLRWIMAGAGILAIAVILYLIFFRN